MKHPKHLIAAGLLATLGLAATAQTQAPPASAAPAPITAAREGHSRADPAKMQERMARMQERMARHLAEFKQKLQLSPAQEGAWNSYVAALKPTPRQRPDRAEFAKLSTPERIDRMRAHRAARMAEMDKRGEATKSFYSVLSADQKKLFDDTTARRGLGGRDCHHGRHHKV